ncbi:MAG: molybdopterin-dependent oxidoreductase [Syntrophobacteraceae bacterium]
MDTRREFFRTLLKLITGMGVFLGSLALPIRWAYSNAERIILPEGTKRETLIDKDPKSLDTRNLEITPLRDFETMGLMDFEVDMKQWRLEVAGEVKTRLQFTYSDILSLPSVEKNVLLICPGFFANYGRWQGVSMKDLLSRAVMESGVTHIIFYSGPEGTYKREFPVADVLANRVFLAYRVNGEALPIGDGYPLRVVAEGYYGSDWIKYVSKMSVGRA